MLHITTAKTDKHKIFFTLIEKWGESGRNDKKESKQQERSMQEDEKKNKEKNHENSILRKS
jgi:hypothetical protein